MGVMKIYSTKTIKNHQNLDGRNENIKEPKQKKLLRSVSCFSVLLVYDMP